jgi:hypothetical protein
VKLQYLGQASRALAAYEANLAFIILAPRDGGSRDFEAARSYAGAHPTVQLSEPGLRFERSA